MFMPTAESDNIEKSSCANRPQSRLLPVSGVRYISVRYKYLEDMSVSVLLCSSHAVWRIDPSPLLSKYVKKSDGFKTLVVNLSGWLPNFLQLPRYSSLLLIDSK